MNVFAVALLASAAFAAPSACADEIFTDTIRVKTSGLDLASRDGAAELRQRIAKAASHACGYYDLRDNNAMREYDQCRREALDAGNAQAAALIARQRPDYASGTVAPQP